MNPKVTVLMSVYNGEKYLRESIDSILNQTFNNFEFLIIDDASTDSSLNILHSYSDPRIKLIKNRENIGQAESLNFGFQKAKGKYIARMDQDDISSLRRLEKQVQFMDNNPEIGISGCWVQTFGENSYIWKYLTRHEYLKWGCLMDTSIFGHSSVIMRKIIIDKYNIRYNKIYLNIADYEMWLKGQELFRLANVNQVLLKYRIRENGSSVTNNIEIRNILNINKLEERLERKLSLKEMDFILGKRFTIFSGWIFLFIDCYGKENTSMGKSYLIKLIMINMKKMIFGKLDLFIKRISFD